MCRFNTKNFYRLKNCERMICSIKVTLGNPRLRKLYEYENTKWPVCNIEKVVLINENVVGLRIQLWSKEQQEWTAKLSILSPRKGELGKCISINPLNEEDRILYGLLL